MRAGDAPRRLADALWGVALATKTLPPWHATNAYLLGTGSVAWLVDPGGDGPAAQAALADLLSVAGVASLRGVLLTHTHPDHLAGVGWVLRRHPQAEAWVHPAGLDKLPRGRPLLPGRRLPVGPAHLVAVPTPGHAPDHLAFWSESDRALVAGDLVAGRGSAWVGLPNGDVADYLASLERVAALRPRLVAPGHGPVRFDGAAVLREAHHHRLDRERALLGALDAGPAVLSDLRAQVYPGLDPAAHDLAERSLLAHLHKLLRERRVVRVGTATAGPYARSSGV